MGDVLRFTGNTIVECTAEDALERAKGWGMELCCVVGFDKDNELCFGGSTSDVAQIVLMLEMAKDKMMQLVRGD